jgi:hypothetical protein
MTAYLTPQEVADLKHKTRQSVINILQDEERRKEIFPNAIKEGEGKRGLWKIPLDEARAWQPREYPEHIEHKPLKNRG